MNVHRAYADLVNAANTSIHQFNTKNMATLNAANANSAQLAVVLSKYGSSLEDLKALARAVDLDCLFAKVATKQAEWTNLGMCPAWSVALRELMNLIKECFKENASVNTISDAHNNTIKVVMKISADCSLAYSAHLDARIRDNPQSSNPPTEGGGFMSKTAASMICVTVIPFTFVGNMLGGAMQGARQGTSLGWKVFKVPGAIAGLGVGAALGSVGHGVSETIKFIYQTVLIGPELRVKLLGLGLARDYQKLRNIRDTLDDQPDLTPEARAIIRELINDLLTTKQNYTNAVDAYKRDRVTPANTQRTQTRMTANNTHVHRKRQVAWPRIRTYKQFPRLDNIPLSMDPADMQYIQKWIVIASSSDAIESDAIATLDHGDLISLTIGQMAWTGPVIGNYAMLSTRESEDDSDSDSESQSDDEVDWAYTAMRAMMTDRDFSIKDAEKWGWFNDMEKLQGKLHVPLLDNDYLLWVTNAEVGPALMWLRPVPSRRVRLPPLPGRQ